MTTTEKQLIALLRLAINGEQDAVLSESIDWKAIMVMALEQSVTGVTFAGIERLPSPRMPEMAILMDWVGQAEKIKTKNDMHHEAVALLAALMEKNGLAYVVFKGNAVATCYGEMQNLRSLGDVDFYVPEWDFQRAMEVIEREWGVEIDRWEADKHYSFNANKVHYEMHYQMETFGSARYQERFSRLIDEYLRRGYLAHFTANGQRVAMLSPALDMMLVMKHWMGHLIGTGIGLRQTLDMAMQIKAYRGTVDVTQLRADLKAIGYKKAFDAVVALAERYYGVRWEEYALPASSGSMKDADKLMATIIKNGNFGRSDYHFKKGRLRRMETTYRFFKYSLRFLNLATWDILCMIPRRVAISIKAH